MQVHKPTRAHAETRSIFLYNLPPYFLRQCLSLKLKLTDLARLAGSELRTLLSPSLSAKITDRCPWALIFPWLLGIWNPGLILVQQEGSFPRPSLQPHRVSLHCTLYGFDKWATKHWLIVLDRTESKNILSLYSKPISLIHLSLSHAFKYLAITDFLTFFIILSLLEHSIVGIIWLKSSSIFRSASFVG